MEDPMESRLSKLEDIIAERNKAMKQFADVFEALRYTVNKVVEDQSGYDREAPISSRTIENRSGVSDHFRDNMRSVCLEIHHAYENLTMMGKIEFPRFDGTNLKNWLFKVEEFFGVDLTPEHLKVKMAVIHFDGQASTWNQCLIQSEVGLEVLNDWTGYVKLMRKQFEDDCDDDQPPNGEFGESIEHRMVNLVPEAQEEKPKTENHEGWEQVAVLEVEGNVERGQEVQGMEKICSAHQVFDKREKEYCVILKQ